ncbi:MAG: hypothetical protein ACJARD_000577 [Alphaproteobacteria bacterium]|jgi:hypothetical protein
MRNTDIMLALSIIGFYVSICMAYFSLDIMETDYIHIVNNSNALIDKITLTEMGVHKQHHITNIAPHSKNIYRFLLRSGAPIEYSLTSQIHQESEILIGYVDSHKSDNYTIEIDINNDIKHYEN